MVKKTRAAVEKRAKEIESKLDVLESQIDYMNTIMELRKMEPFNILDEP